MIDVPARVKDALRSGQYRKEYRIEVPDCPDTSKTELRPPDITIRQVEDPWETISWTIDPITLVVEHSSVEIIIDSPVVFYIHFGDSAYNPIAYPDFFVFTDTETIFTPTNLTPGNYFFYFYSNQPFTCIKATSYSSLVITNDNLVWESVKMDERMCSDSKLKFGLCEGTSIEFQYFEKPVILGYKINVIIRVQYKDENGELAWHEIPMGKYEVDECSRQASTGIIKAIAYNKLKSEYLNADMKSQIERMLIEDSDHSIPLIDILNSLLEDYSITGSNWVPVPLKVIPESTGFSAGQYEMYYYNSATQQWESCRTGSNPPSNAPSSGGFTLYRVLLDLLPQNESSTTTTGFYKYTVDLKKLYNTIQPYLMSFFDLRNGSVVVNDARAFARGISGQFLTQTQPWPDFIAQWIGSISYLQGNDYDISSSSPGAFTTNEFSDHLPFLNVDIAVTGDTYSPFLETSVTPDPAIQARITSQINTIKNAIEQSGAISIVRKDTTPIEEYRVTLSNLDSISAAITLRDIQSAAFEIDCQYGKLDRSSDLFAGIELNNGGLYPQDTLYPATNLYPQGESDIGFRSMYSKLWANEGNVRSFRYLIITYKTTEVVDGQTREIEAKLQKTVNANGTDDYEMSDNWLFKNFVWTSTQIGTYADAMVVKMQNLRWFPFEMWCAGLPYIEAGDAIEIQMNEGTYKSYVLRRVLSGIQNLQDEMINGTLDIF